MRKLGVRYSVRILTQPETNIRLGMRYFKDLMDRFGAPHYALASYNAGESRIAQWIAERPGYDQDEFVDDIPFPETQNYVKRILGTADDYRRLYGEEFSAPVRRADRWATSSSSQLSPNPPISGFTDFEPTSFR